MLTRLLQQLIFCFGFLFCFLPHFSQCTTNLQQPCQAVRSVDGLAEDNDLTDSIRMRQFAWMASAGKIIHEIWHWHGISSQAELAGRSLAVITSNSKGQISTSWFSRFHLSMFFSQQSATCQKPGIGPWRVHDLARHFAARAPASPQSPSKSVSFQVGQAVASTGKQGKHHQNPYYTYIILYNHIYIILDRLHNLIYNITIYHISKIHTIPYTYIIFILSNNEMMISPPSPGDTTRPEVSSSQGTADSAAAAARVSHAARCATRRSTTASRFESFESFQKWRVTMYTYVHMKSHMN